MSNYNMADAIRAMNTHNVMTLMPEVLAITEQPLQGLKYRTNARYRHYRDKRDGYTDATLTAIDQGTRLEVQLEQKLLSTPVLPSRLLARSFSIELRPEGKSRLHHGRIHLFALLIKGRSLQSASLHLPFERATKHKVTHLWSLIGSRTV